MGVDGAIVQLGAKLDAWWDEFSAMLDSEDRAAQAEALVGGLEMAKELDRLKANGLAAIQELLDDRSAPSEKERAKSLIRGFELGAKLADTLHDEFGDMETEIKVMRLLDDIVLALDGVGSGRTSIATLLNHPNLGVRVVAGVYLVDLLPKQVVPILRAADEKKDASSASFRAHWTLLAWERERKSRFNYLSAGSVA